MEDLYIPLRLSVRSVLWFLQQELPHPTFNHSFLVDEFLADLFLSFQLHYGDQTGGKAVMKRAGVEFHTSTSGDSVDAVLNRASSLLLAEIANIIPDYSEEKSLDPDQQISYSYYGGENLVLYIPYVREKYPNIPTTVLVPRVAVVNSTINS